MSQAIHTIASTVLALEAVWMSVVPFLLDVLASVGH